MDTWVTPGNGIARRVLHVVPSIAEEASGPSHTVPGLSGAQRRLGADSTVVALGDPLLSTPDVMLFQRRSMPERLGRSPEMRSWLQEQVAANPNVILHNHSLWMFPNLYPGLVARRQTGLQVVSPRGTLSEWAFSHGSFAKKLIWPAQRWAVERTSGWHATSELERDDIRAKGFRQPIAVVPNGVDLPVMADRPERDVRTLLFLGRIHPKKGVDLLLRSWKLLQQQFPAWQLVVAGPDNDGHLSSMKRLAAELRLARCSFVGPRFGVEKSELFNNADLFVLPSHSENFGLAVAEAMAAGVPVVASRATPWRVLQEQDAGWWVNLPDLTLVLEDALRSSPQRLSEMGRRGRSYAERALGWDAVGASLLDFYDYLSTGVAKPEFVDD